MSKARHLAWEFAATIAALVFVVSVATYLGACLPNGKLDKGAVAPVIDAVRIGADVLCERSDEQPELPAAIKFVCRAVRALGALPLSTTPSTVQVEGVTFEVFVAPERALQFEAQHARKGE